MRFAILAALAVCLSVPAFADPPTAAGSALTSAFGAGASDKPLTVADVKALVELVRGPAQAPVPVATTTTTTAPAATISDGVLGFSWAQILGWLGGLVSMALGAFAIFKTASWLKARALVEACAEGAWHVAERAGAIYSLPGATKAALAIAAFYEAMTGHGISVVSQAQVDSAHVLWTSMSAKASTATGGVTVVAPEPEVLAKAQAAAQVASAPGTLADKSAAAAS